MSGVGGRRVHVLTLRKRRFRTAFFNTEDGSVIRILMHPYFQRHTSMNKDCVLCG